MNRLYIILIMLLIISELTAQSCLSEGVLFYSQEDIDNFQTNYPNCTQIEGDVTISGSNITNLNGLNVVTSIESNLTIYGTALTSLTGLEGISSIEGNLDIDANLYLTSLTGLESISSIGGSLYIGGFEFGGNPALTSLSGLDNLISIGGNLIIFDNFSLTSLTGLEGLSSIGGGLYIGGYGYGGNPDLASLSGLDNLISIIGNLDINSNAYLTSLTGLDNVSSIGGDFYIEGNPALASLSGLDNLISIGGNLEIISNGSMTCLMESNKLASINGDILIINNDMVQSLVGLCKIDGNSISNIYIHDNTNLSICHVKGICDYLSDPYGVVDIHQNAIGCNSLEKVKEECDSSDVCEYFSVSNLETINTFSIFPNPSSNQFTFSFTLKHPTEVNLEIKNLLGQVLLVIKEENMSLGMHYITWNSNGMQSGLYVYHLSAGDQSLTGKLVLLR